MYWVTKRVTQVSPTAGGAAWRGNFRSKFCRRSCLDPFEYDLFISADRIRRAGKDSGAKFGTRSCPVFLSFRRALITAVAGQVREPAAGGATWRGNFRSKFWFCFGEGLFVCFFFTSLGIGPQGLLLDRWMLGNGDEDARC